MLKMFRMLFALKCSESTRLISESLDRNLSSGERLAVRIHALVCRSCKSYRRHLTLLRTTLHSLGETDPFQAAPDGPKLSTEARERIRRLMAEDR